MYRISKVFFFLHFCSTVTDICVQFCIINVISVSAAFGFIRHKKYFLLFLQSMISLTKEVALNFVCKIKFLSQKCLRCYGELLTSRPRLREMFTSVIISSKESKEEHLGRPSISIEADHAKTLKESMVKNRR